MVYYWCNYRTEGALKNRQAEKLQEKTKAEGTTDKFKAELLGSQLDFAALGHAGPAVEEKQATQARSEGLVFRPYHKPPLLLYP